MYIYIYIYIYNPNTIVLLTIRYGVQHTNGRSGGESYTVPMIVQ